MSPRPNESSFVRFARTGRCRDIQQLASWPIIIILAAGSWIALSAEWHALGLLADGFAYPWLSHALAYPAFLAMIAFHAIAAINFGFYARGAVARLAYFPCQAADRMRDSRERKSRAARAARPLTSDID